MEELATRTGVSVDTIRYYQGKGLLDPPRRAGRLGFYNDDHVARLERVRALRERGFTLATIARVVSGELDAADQALISELSVDRSSAGRDPASGLTLDDLAARTGVPIGLLQALVTEGLLVPRRLGAEDRFTDEDVDAVRAGLSILERGVPYHAALALARRYHEATEAVAEAAVDLFSTHVRHRLRAGDAGAGDGPELVEAYTDLLAAVTTLVGHHFTRVLLSAAVSHIEEQERSGDPGAPTPAEPARARRPAGRRARHAPADASGARS